MLSSPVILTFDHCFFHHAEHQHLGDSSAAIFFDHAERD